MTSRCCSPLPRLRPLERRARQRGRERVCPNGSTRAVAAYFRVFVLLRDARDSVGASASAAEEALELGGAGATDAGAFCGVDGPDSSDFAERSGDADGRRFFGVHLISFVTLGRVTPTQPFDISSSSLQNPAGKSACLGVLWV